MNGSNKSYGTLRNATINGSNNDGTAINCTINGSNNDFKCTSCTINGSNCDIVGDNNIINGSNNDIRGNNNIVKGSNNDVKGNNNNVKGRQNTVQGSNNINENLANEGGSFYINGVRYANAGSIGCVSGGTVTINHSRGGGGVVSSIVNNGRPVSIVDGDVIYYNDDDTIIGNNGIKFSSNKNNAKVKSSAKVEKFKEDYESDSDEFVAKKRKTDASSPFQQHAKPEKKEEKKKEEKKEKKEDKNAKSDILKLPDPIKDEEDELKGVPDQYVCTQCMERLKKTTCLPCGHSFFCVTCSIEYGKSKKTCPVCSEPLTEIKRQFYN